MLIITLHGKYHLSLEYTACSKENYHQKKKLHFDILASYGLPQVFGTNKTEQILL